MAFPKKYSKHAMKTDMDYLIFYPTNQKAK
jgi:hypothetical protein